jgi:hypothetical protein
MTTPNQRDQRARRRAGARIPHATLMASGLFCVGTAVMAGIAPGALTKRPLAAATTGFVQQQWHSVFNREGRFLTKPSQRAPDAIALDYIRRNAAAFALAPDDVRTLVVEKHYTSPGSGAHHLAIGQRVEGMRVHNALINAGIDRQGRLAIIGGRVGSLRTSGNPRLTASDALQRAAGIEGVTLALPASARTIAKGKHRFQNTAATRLKHPTPLGAELVWFIQRDRSLRLAWLTDLELSGRSWHETLVDAESGAVLARENRYDHVDARVFTGQHPDDSPGGRQLVGLAGINGPWLDVVPGATVTSGNNVLAYQDFDNSNAIGYQPIAVDDNAFDFTFSDAWRGLALIDDVDFANIPEADWQAAITADRDAAITQLFYYTNDMHDWLYGYGFDEASGNFQVDNLGNGGSDGDPVLAEAHDGFDFGCDSGARCANNANFGTDGDGTTARMQMYLWIRPNRPYRDGNFDGDVIAHEYGHGVSNRLVPGTISGGTNQAGSLGEGWSDTISFLRWGDTMVGEYVTGNATSGIRNFAYDAHPWTYGDYSTGVTSPHRNGEIWAAAMYLIRTRLGIDTTTRLVLDGMRSTPNGPTPTFLDARDGILAADMLNNGGANFCALSASFAERGMGENAASNGLHAVPTEDFTAASACRPTADAGGPYTTNEGSDLQLSATASTAGSHASASGTLSYAWDLDNDGAYDDATGATATFDQVGQDGSFSVGLQVTDGYGLTDTATATVNVGNVLPTVSIDAISPVDEQGTVTISGTITDPGWLEPLEATIDFDDGSGVHALGGSLENARPDAVLSFQVQRQYGDNGNYDVQVCGRDRLAGAANPQQVCYTAQARIDNLDPTLAIQTGAMQSYNGKQAFLLQLGETLEVPGTATDPGSDDLTFTWSWDDGTPDDVQVSLVNPPGTDPAKSPSVQPRDVSLAQSHLYAGACLYDIGLAVADDDGGSASDSAAVVVTGNADLSRGSGWWLNQYRTKKPNVFTSAQLQCYLDIVTYFSSVFTAPLNRAQATQILQLPAKSPMLTMFREQLLSAWLNFANGAVSFDTPVDTNGDGVADTTWAAAILHAENVANNPASTNAQIKAQKDIVERIVLRDQ